MYTNSYGQPNNNSPFSTTSNDANLLSVSPIDTPTPVSRVSSLVFQESMNISSRSSLASKTATLSTHTPSTSQKMQRKCLCQEAFADENQAEAKILTSLAGKKYAQKMAEHVQRMVELGIKKQWMDLEAIDKWLQAEDH